MEEFVKSLPLNSFTFLLLAQAIIFVLGWPLEWTEIIVIFVPIFLPLLDDFGVDPLFFGILIALNLQTSFLSPPVAMAAFYLKGVAPQARPARGHLQGLHALHLHRRPLHDHGLRLPRPRHLAARAALSATPVASGTPIQLDAPPAGGFQEEEEIRRTEPAGSIDGHRDHGRGRRRALARPRRSRPAIRWRRCPTASRRAASRRPRRSPAAMLERLGLVALRAAPARPGRGGALLAGPMLEARLLRDGAAGRTAALRHARVSAAVIGVLAEPLEPDADGAAASSPRCIPRSMSRPRASAMAPADDAGAAPPTSRGLGLCGGRARRARRRRRRSPRPGAGGAARRAARAGATSPTPSPQAAAARAPLGGLPAGALLVVAGLTPPAAPQAGQAWTARLAPLGRVRAMFVAGIDG